MSILLRDKFPLAIHIYLPRLWELYLYTYETFEYTNDGGIINQKYQFFYDRPNSIIDKLSIRRWYGRQSLVVNRSMDYGGAEILRGFRTLGDRHKDAKIEILCIFYFVYFKS